MEIQLGQLHDGKYRLEMIVMPRGEHHLEVIEPGDCVALVVISGEVTAQYQGPVRAPARALKARRGAPVFLVSPGTYSVIADKNTLGFRGSRTNG